MTVSVRVEGLPELRRKLRRLDRARIKSLAIGPVRGAGNIIEREIAAKAPRGTEPLRPGAVRLAESVVTYDVEGKDAAVRTGPRDFTSLFIEFGFKHAGDQSQVPAQPFIRPAYHAKKQQAQRHAVDGIRKAIERRAPHL